MMGQGRDREKEGKEGGDLSEPTINPLQWREGGFSPRWLDTLQYQGCLFVRVCLHREYGAKLILTPGHSEVFHLLHPRQQQMLMGQVTGH